MYKFKLVAFRVKNFCVANGYTNQIMLKFCAELWMLFKKRLQQIVHTSVSSNKTVHARRLMHGKLCMVDVSCTEICAVRRQMYVILIRRLCPL